MPDGRLVESLSDPLDPVPDVLPAHAALGARAPIQDAARDWIEDARRRVRHGTVVVIDYAVPTTAELAGRPWREWLRTYRAHERGDHYLADPGRQDITTEVAIDQLPGPDAIRTQAQWLQLHGIGELVEEGKRHWDAHAARPDLEAIRMRSRVARGRGPPRSTRSRRLHGARVQVAWRLTAPAFRPVEVRDCRLRCDGR